MRSFWRKKRKMRKLPFLMACWVLAALPALVSAQSPISSFPYDEGFSAQFNPDAEVFLPNWRWNRGASGQLFQFNWQGRSDMFSLAMLPDGKAPVYADVYLNLSGKSNTFMGFWVASLKNGGARDLQRSYMSVSISTNGGKSFGFETPIGPAKGFENQTTTYQYFQYPFPPVTDNRDKVVVRFSVWSEEGPQQPAIMLLDDIHFAQAPKSATPPFIVSLN
jgi:hypothetical protein